MRPQHLSANGSNPMAPMREARAYRPPLPPLQLHAELLLAAAGAMAVICAFFVVALIAQAVGAP